MPGVFCSFTNNDLPFAHDLAMELTQHSYPVWFDRFRINLVGTPLTPEITAALHGCDCVVVVVSSETPNSLWVQQEVNIARDLGLPVLQIVLGDAPAFPGRADEHYADVAREGRERAVNKIVRAVGRFCRHDFELGVEPIIPLFLESTTRVNLFALQQRLEHLEGERDRLHLGGDSVQVSIEADGSLPLMRSLELQHDPLVGQVLALVHRFDARMRDGIAMAIGNTHQWRMFQGTRGAWSTYTGYLVIAFFEIIRSIVMARLLRVSDRGMRRRLAPADRRLPTDPTAIQQDPVHALLGRPTDELDVFHKGSRVSEFDPVMWKSKSPAAKFTVPADGSLCAEVRRFLHVEATDFPHELCKYVVPQMLLNWVLQPDDRKVWWDFDACAIGPH